MVYFEKDLNVYYNSPEKQNVTPRLRGYVHNDNTLHEAMLVLPGGAYAFTSPREAEPVAMEYFNSGYNAFVLDYSVAPDKYPLALLQAAACVALIRRDKDCLCNGKVYAIGFSAGGHLCGCLGILWNEKVISEALGVDNITVRPDGIIMSYPVVTSGEYAHRDSFVNLCGDNEELIQYLSLADRVNENSAPAFIWHTAEDGAVPVENSLMLAQAYRRAGVPFELHIFPKGWHGLSLCNDSTSELPQDIAMCKHVSQWIELSKNWLKNLKSYL